MEAAYAEHQVATHQVPPIASGVDLLHTCEDFALATWRNVFIVAWMKETRAEHARQVGRQLEEFRSTHKAGVLLLTVVSEHAPPPDGSARTEIATYLAAGQEILAGAVLIDGGTLRAAFVRGVATGLTLLARQPFPFRVVSGIGGASQLFAACSARRGVPFRAADFSTTVAIVRERLARQLAPGT